MTRIRWLNGRLRGWYAASRSAFRWRGDHRRAGHHDRHGVALLALQA